MPVKAGQIVIDITAGTQKFVVDMEAASAKIRQVGKEAHGAVSGVQAVSGTLRVMEGNVTNNLRAAERWVASLPGVANALKVAFPVVGAVAFAGIIGELGGKVRDFFKEIQEAPGKVSNAFRALNDPLRTTNDQLQVTNDRLENDIAKLEGKRQNTLKLALDEARVAADKLAESLDKDLQSLAKLTAENNLGGFKAWLTGQASTSGDTEELKRFADNMAHIDAEGIANVRAAQTKESAQAAQDAWNKKALESLDKEIAKYKQLAAESEKLQGYHQGKGQAPSYQQYVHNPSAYAPWGIQASTPDQSVSLNERNGALENLRNLRDRTALESTNAALTMKKGALTEVSEKDKSDPFGDRMKALSAQLDGVKAKLAAIGKGEAAQTVAHSFAEAQKAIEEVNKSLEKHKTKLTSDQEAQIRGIEQSIAAAEAETTWREKLESTTTSINDRIESQQLLTAAIGNGYEATKQANVETQLMSALGQHYHDQSWMQSHAGDVNSLRSGFGQEYDAKHGEQVATAVDGLNRQIQLEKDLAAVQSQGAEVVRQVTLVSKLRQMVTEGATREQIKAEIELYNAERRNASAAAVAGINQKIAATKALTAAVFEGAEAQRKAGLESKYGEMALQGDSPDQIAAERRLDSAEHTKTVTEEAAKTVNAYSDQLDKLNRIEAVLQAQKKDHGDTLELEMALRDIENQRLQLAVQEELKLRGAKDGIKAFFLEMQEDAKSAANIIYDSLNSALDKVSDQFGKLLTGKKTSWGKAFESLGQDMVKESTKSIMQKGLGALGKSLGIHPPTGKPDGTPQNPYYVVMQGAKPAVPGAAGTPDPTAAAGGAVAKGALGALGGALGGLLGKLGGLFSGGGGTAVSSSISFMAGGGDADPGRVYGVAEAGEAELISPKNSSRITPISKLGGTHNYSYSIDARGADLGAENRVARAIEFAHNSAVSSSVRANSERAKRTPKRS